MNIFILNVGQADLIVLFLKYGADVNIPDPFGQTALHLAVENGNLQIFKYAKTKHIVVLECWSPSIHAIFS